MEEITQSFSGLLEKVADNILNIYRYFKVMARGAYLAYYDKKPSVILSKVESYLCIEQSFVH